MAAVAEPKIQEIPNSDEETEEVAEEEEEAGQASSSGPAKQSRNEKKARQALGKLGLKPFPGIDRVTVRQTRDVLFVVARPDVYKLDDKFVVFGEMGIEDLNASASKDALEQLAARNPSSLAAASGGAEAAASGMPTASSSASASGASSSAAVPGDVAVKEDDIQLVMKQAKVEREQAQRALVEAGGDIVNAIMALSKM